MARKRNLKRSLVIAVFLLAVVGMSCPVLAVSWKVTQVTDNDDYDCNPQISGSNVVWEGEDGNDREIFFWDGDPTSEPINISDNSYDDFSPQISGSNVVWEGEDVSVGDQEIFFWDGTTITQVTDNSYDDYNPQISGSNVVWQGSDDSDYEIFFWDGTTITKVTNNNYNDSSPRISGSNVVWRGRVGNDWEIFFWDASGMGEPYQVTDNSYPGGSPRISGSNVVWFGYDGSDNEIFFWDPSMDEPYQVTDNSYNDSYPQISGSNVVWFGYDGDDWEIFFWDDDPASGPINISNNSNYSDFSPQISGSNVVWEGEDVSVGDQEIFFWDGTTITQVTDNSYDDYYPQISGSNVVWQHYDGDDDEIFMAVPVPTIYVDADATSGANNGTSWENAYLYLQDALDDPCLLPVSEIWVAAGTYRPDANSSNPNGSGDRTATFQLINGVAIYGGFAGTESTLDERDFELYETILSGDIGTEGVNTDNSYHVVTGSGTEPNAVLDGFTITAGNANGSYPHSCAGGLFNDSGSPTVTNCTFSGNSAGDRGGGMYNVKSSPTVTNCTFSGNSASSGGGMHNYNNSSPTVTNCTFSGNSVVYSGGGMYNDKSSPTVTNCTFSENSTQFSGGGGMFNYKSTNPTLTNCIFWGDTAPIAPEIRNYQSSPTVTYSDIAGSGGSSSWDLSLGTDGGGNIDANPLFADADLRLSVGSPCIDAGDNTAVPGGVTTDLDGNPRFVDDPDTTDTGNGTPPIVDMGAYEYQPTPPPSIIYVDADATGGANNGTSWENAYLFLQDALDDPCLVSGGEIWVAQGIYKPDANSADTNGSGDRTATFQLINGVGLYGGFVGFGEPDPNERDVEQYKTLLSGDIGTAVINTDNSYHVVTGSGTEPNAVLDGFTITAGNANGSYPHSCAGGLFNDSGSPTVTNCTFRMNRASNSGGGMYNRYSAPTVTNCIFSVNSAGNYGGAMRNYQSSPALTNCTLIGNSANSGGGMGSSNSSSPTVTNCTFSGNSAKDGGGMYNWNGGSPTVSNCILWGNIAGGGAQIYNDGTSSATVSYSDVEGGWNGTGNIPADPLFVDANGPDGIAGTEDDNVHLRGYSPCINAGDPGGDYSGQVDVDGQPRVAYGRVDMGADEVFPAAGDFEPDGDVDFADFAEFAIYWMETNCGNCGGADLTCEGDVDFYDLKVLTDNWLLGH